MENTKITPFVEELEALLRKIEIFYTAKLGIELTDFEDDYMDDLRDMIVTIKTEIDRVKLIDDRKVEILNDDLYYETSYLENLLMEDILTISVALIQAKNVIRSAGDMLHAASKVQ